MNSYTDQDIFVYIQNHELKNILYLLNKNTKTMTKIHKIFFLNTLRYNFTKSFIRLKEIAFFRFNKEKRLKIYICAVSISILLYPSFSFLYFSNFFDLIIRIEYFIE